MDQDIYRRISYLMERCMLEQETVDERHELDLYSHSEEYQEYIQHALIEAYTIDKPLVDLADAQQIQILEAIGNLANKRRFIGVKLFRWATVAAMLIGIIWVAVNNSSSVNEMNLVKSDIDSIDRVPQHESPDRRPVSVQEVEPRKNTLMILADGSKIDIERLKVGEFIAMGALKVKKMDNCSLWIQFENAVSLQDTIGLNTISTPKGTFYNLILGDGTKVQLNASSTLKFPSRFGLGQRDVYLVGEGYFEVTKDRFRKFVVHSGSGMQKQEVVVYGTVFNVMAYPDKRQFVTTLVEGSVKVLDPVNKQESFLLPHQQAILQGDRMVVQKADLSASLAWRNNLFYFADQRLGDVMSEISRWYDVEIHAEGLVLDQKIWAQISRDKTLSEVLELLAITNNVQLDVKGKEVYIKGK